MLGTSSWIMNGGNGIHARVVYAHGGSRLEAVVQALKASRCYIDATEVEIAESDLVSAVCALELIESARARILILNVDDIPLAGELREDVQELRTRWKVYVIAQTGDDRHLPQDPEVNGYIVTDYWQSTVEEILQTALDYLGVNPTQ